MRIYYFFIVLVVSMAFLQAGPSEERSGVISFKGRVTAVDSNANRPGFSFTAVDSEGRVKMFYIDNLKHLDLNDRVELHYRNTGKFPLSVTRIRFLQPQ